MVELDDLSFFSFKWFEDDKQHLDVEHFFHTFPGIFCFLTNPCLVQMIRLLGAIFQGQLGCYFQGVGPPLNLGSIPGLELAPQRSHKVGWNRFWGTTFCGGKFWKLTKNNLFFWADPEKNEETHFFFDGWFVFFQSKWSWFLPVGRNSINYKPVEWDGMMWVVPPPSDSQDYWYSDLYLKGYRPGFKKWRWEDGENGKWWVFSTSDRSKGFAGQNFSKFRRLEAKQKHQIKGIPATPKLPLKNTETIHSEK